MMSICGISPVVPFRMMRADNTSVATKPAINPLDAFDITTSQITDHWFRLSLSDDPDGNDAPCCSLPQARSRFIYSIDCIRPVCAGGSGLSLSGFGCTNSGRVFARGGDFFAAPCFSPFWPKRSGAGSFWVPGLICRHAASPFPGRKADRAAAVPEQLGCCRLSVTGSFGGKTQRLYAALAEKEWRLIPDRTKAASAARKAN